MWLRSRQLALLVSSAIAIAPALHAQSKPAEADQKLFETIEVRVINLDAIVTGKDGKPVTGLAKGDFEVFENGVKQEITNFVEVRGKGPAASPAPAPAAQPETPEPERRPRRIVIFIDNATIHPFHRNAVLEATGRFLQNNVRQGDQVMIATWASSLAVVLPLTSDRAAMDAALKRLASQTTLGAKSDKEEYRWRLQVLISEWRTTRSRQVELGPPFDQGLDVARIYAKQAAHDMRQKQEALKSVLAALRLIEGRKILVLVTERFSDNPSDYFLAYLDSIKQNFAGGANATPLSESSDFLIPALVPGIADAANSSGVTLYPINGAGKESDIEDVLPDPSAQGSTLPSTPMIHLQSGSMTMHGIAEATGGTALNGSSNWNLALDSIASDLDSYYSIGYRATGKRQDRINNVEVRLKNRKYSVRARRAIVEKSIASELVDSVVGNLFYPVSKNDLMIEATAGAPAAATGNSISVPLAIRIPMESLTLLPDGSDLTGSFVVCAAFSRSDGAVSKVDNQVREFRFPAESLKRRKDLTVKLDVATDPHTDAISIGVMDDRSHVTGYATVKIAAPPEASPPAAPQAK
ncbi:MAG TPA: VWA domain-containing protein [Thermoanaerobaculia bacterium]|nr:VWA domain-containing protein [Thermoanaerobaculia bacterium]